MLDCFVDDMGNVAINDQKRANPGDPVLVVNKKGFIELARFLLNADQDIECETFVQGEMVEFTED
jgi:hypothetical protein